MLLDRGADVRQVSEDGATDLMAALMLACKNGHHGVVGLLLEQDADVELLIKGGANVEQVDKYEATALMWACENGHHDVVKLLLDRGAGMEQVDKGGSTALMLACKNGHHDVVELLLDRGADVEKVDTHEDAALVYACEHGHHDVVGLLLDRGVEVSDKEAGHLIRACKNVGIDIVELFIRLIEKAPIDKLANHLESFRKIIITDEGGDMGNGIRQEIMEIVKPKKNDAGAVAWAVCARAFGNLLKELSD